MSCLKPTFNPLHTNYFYIIAPQLGGYLCTCAPGWTGKNCDVKLGLCSSEPCLNLGRCVENGIDFSCLCTPGFQGSSLVINLDNVYAIKNFY